MMCSRFTVGALLLLVPACGPEPEGRADQSPERDTEALEHPEIQLVDDAGREHRFSHSPSRILSLVPSATEVVIALDVSDRLVGRTDFDTASAVRFLPSVGGGLQPSVEAVLSLDPDLVIRFGAETDPFTPERLDQAGIAHFAVRPERIEDVRRMVRSLGRIVGEEQAAEDALHQMQRALEEVEATVAPSSRPRVAYLVGGSPPWVAGAGTFIHELLEIAGAENVFAELPRPYAEVSLEVLAERDPDHLLVVEGAPLPSNLPGRDRVRRVSSLTRSPGLRLADAAWELVRVLHPDALR